MQEAIKKILYLLAICCVSTHIFAGNSSAIAQGFYLNGEKSEKSLYAFEARNNFQKALALDPKNPGYLSHYAWFLHLYDFTEEAPPAFNNSLENHQGQGYVRDMYKSLSWDEFYMGNIAAAVNNFQFVYDSPWLKSNYTNATAIAGTLADEELKAKIRELKKKLALDPNNFDIQKELFDNYRYHMEYKNAIALGSVLMTNSKTDNFTRLEFARTLFKGKEYNQAAIQYQQLMQQFPRNAFLAYEWGTDLVELQQYDAAYNMFSESLTYYPTPEAKAALAKLEARKGNCDTALNLLSSISDKDKSRSIYLLGMGDVYRECKQYQLANQYYQAVLEQYPYNSDALWGVLSSTAAAHRYAGNRLAYDHWQEVYNWNRSALQNQLVNYYQSPMIPFNSDYYDNSTTYTRLDLGTAYDFYAGANTRLNLSYAYAKFTQEGFNSIYRNMVQLQGSKLFSEHWQLMAGISDKNYSNDNNNVNGNVAVKYTWWQGLDATLEYKHLDIIDTEPPFGIQIYNYIVTIGAAAANIRTNDYSGSMYFQATRRLALWGRATYGNYSDGNDKTQGSFEASYQLFDVPQIKIIYDYFYLNFARPSSLFCQNNNCQSAYYDPINLQIHIAKLRMEHYFTENLHAGIEDGESFFPQSSSFANGVLGYIDYIIIPQLTLRVAGQYYNQAESVTRTTNHGNPFWAKGGNLSLTYNF